MEYGPLRPRLCPQIILITVADHNDNATYPNTRNRLKLCVNKARTLQGDKMVKITGAKIWNLLTDELKENLKSKSSFQLKKSSRIFI